MKDKSWIKYLIYGLLIFGLIYLNGYVEKQQTIYQKETFNLSVAYYAISMIIKIGIGSILGLEYIINEMRKEGTWKVNLPKVLLIVIPSLYFAISYFAFYGFVENSIYTIITAPMFVFMQNDHSFVYIF